MKNNPELFWFEMNEEDGEKANRMEVSRGEMIRRSQQQSNDFRKLLSKGMEQFRKSQNEEQRESPEENEEEGKSWEEDSFPRAKPPTPPVQLKRPSLNEFDLNGPTERERIANSPFKIDPKTGGNIKDMSQYIRKMDEVGMESSSSQGERESWPPQDDYPEFDSAPCTTGRKLEEEKLGEAPIMSENDQRDFISRMLSRKTNFYTRIQDQIESLNGMLESFQENTRGNTCTLPTINTMRQFIMMQVYSVNSNISDFEAVLKEKGVTMMDGHIKEIRERVEEVKNETKKAEEAFKNRKSVRFQELKQQIVAFIHSKRHLFRILKKIFLHCILLLSAFLILMTFPKTEGYSALPHLFVLIKTPTFDTVLFFAVLLHL